MEANRHKNSKRVTIFRAGSFADDAQTGAADFMSMSRKGIGTYFQNNLGKAIGTGLDFNEIDILLPTVVDIPAGDRAFREAVTNFYSSVSTNIPHGTGKEFEIGLLLDNSKPVTYTEKAEDGTVLRNLPISINEYIRYRHAIKHPRVAMSRDEAKGNVLIDFYVFDPEQVMEHTTLLTDIKDKAMTTYLSLKDDTKKVDMMLTLLLVDPRMFSGKNAAAERQGKLRELADGKPVEFVREHADADFDERYVLQTLINTGIINKYGDRHADAEMGDILGNSTKETLLWMKDKVNSDRLSLMKARMQESLKKSVPNPNKKPARTTAR